MELHAICFKHQYKSCATFVQETVKMRLTGKKRSPEADSSASRGTANDVSGMSGSIGALGHTKAPTAVCRVCTSSFQAR